MKDHLSNHVDVAVGAQELCGGLLDHGCPSNSFGGRSFYGRGGRALEASAEAVVA